MEQLYLRVLPISIVTYIFFFNSTQSINYESLAKRIYSPKESASKTLLVASTYYTPTQNRTELDSPSNDFKLQWI